MRAAMTFFYYLSDFIIPLIIFYIIAYALTEKVSVYDEFVSGAADVTEGGNKKLGPTLDRSSRRAIVPMADGHSTPRNRRPGVWASPERAEPIPGITASL